MCEPLAKAVRDCGVNALAFNAKLSAGEKVAVLDGWRKGTVNFVVATIAFGMGIDRPNVRFRAISEVAHSGSKYPIRSPLHYPYWTQVRRVIHWNISKCIEA
jgi:superfamily II DNA/RNA helicase